MNRFQKLAGDYLITPTPQTGKAVRDELAVDKEFLGFKYWVIKSSETLSATFAGDVLWNKS